MGILAVHITTAKIRAFHENQAALGYLGHPGQIGGWWVPQNDVTMEAVRADDYFPLSPVTGVRNAPRTASHLERFFEWSTARLGLTAERLIRDNLTSQVGQETPRYVFESSRAHGSIVGEKHTAVYQ